MKFRCNSVQKQELLDSIINKQEIPHKFCYLDGDGSTWTNVTEDFDLAKREFSILHKFLKLIHGKLKEKRLNVILVGSGNGKEIPIIVNGLGIYQIVNFALIDISPELLIIAKSYGKGQFKDLEFSSFVVDMTNQSISEILKEFHKSRSSSNLILVTANGGLLSDSNVLKDLRMSMASQDQLLITLETYSEDRESIILEQFKSPSIIKLFANGVSHIGINDSTPDQFEFIYNKEKSMIEGYFLTEQWLELHNIENITFEVPISEKIKIFSSLRPTPAKFRELLIAGGFEIELFQNFEEQQICGVLCSAK